MAPKKRTYSDVSESSDDNAPDNSSTVLPGPPVPAPSTPAATQNAPAAPRPTPSLPTTTPTRPVAIPPLTKSQIKRQGMTSCGSPTGGPTPRGSSYGYEHRMPTDSYPDYRNSAQRTEVERLRAADLVASASRQPGMSSMGTSNVLDTPSTQQYGARVQEPNTQTASSQRDSNVDRRQAPLQAPPFPQYNHASLPRPGPGAPYGTYQPSGLPRSGSRGTNNARFQTVASSPPPWRGSSYASSNAYGSSGAPSRAAGLAALSNIPGDPAYNPPAVPSIWGGDHWTGIAATGAGDDPFTFPHTTVSNRPGGAGPQQQDYIPQRALQQPWYAQGYAPGTELLGAQSQDCGDGAFGRAATTRVEDVPQHLLRPSSQYGGFAPPYAPTSRTHGFTHDNQPSAEPPVPSVPNQGFDWRVSPNPELEDVVARDLTAAPAHEANVQREGQYPQAQQGPEVTPTYDSAASRQARQTQSYDTANTEVVSAEHVGERDVGTATHAREASSG